MISWLQVFPRAVETRYPSSFLIVLKASNPAVQHFSAVPYSILCAKKNTICAEISFKAHSKYETDILKMILFPKIVVWNNK